MRTKSWLLLLIPLGILCMGIGVLILKKSLQGYAFLPWLGAVAAAALALQLFLQSRKTKLDVWIFPLTMFFSSLGIIMVARLKPELLIPQLRWLLIGMLLFLLVVRYADRLQ